MTTRIRIPRILMVAPTLAFLPEGVGADTCCVPAGSDVAANLCAALFDALVDVGAEIHLALPNYRTLFQPYLPAGTAERAMTMRDVFSSERLHFAEDRSFYYVDRRWLAARPENRLKLSLAFQREVIHTIMPTVQPDLVHCFGWMTGLVPPAARRRGAKSVFTAADLESVQCPLWLMEDQGIDAAAVWQQFYYERMPAGYEETRPSNPADLLATGLFSADCVAFPGEDFMRHTLADSNPLLPHPLKTHLQSRVPAGTALAMPSYLPPGCRPDDAPGLTCRYGPADHVRGKRRNKQALYREFRFHGDDRAPLLLVAVDSGTPAAEQRCLADMLAAGGENGWSGVRCCIAVDEDAAEIFRRPDPRVRNRSIVAIRREPQTIGRLFAAADAVIAPSPDASLPPPHLVALAYGAIPLYGRTGQDDPEYLAPLDISRGTGNAVIYEAGDPQAFGRAIQQALGFLLLPAVVRRSTIRRIMQQAAFDLGACGVADAYIDLYEAVLARSLIAAEGVPEILHPPADESDARGATHRRRKSKRSHRVPEPFFGLNLPEPACR
jgi:starch synthase